MSDGAATKCSRPVPSPIGTRIHIMGDSCAGKSTLGKRLAKALGVPFVDMDALNWLPNWVALSAVDPGEFERRLQEATADKGWVVAGSYTRFAQRVMWPRVETIIWLDLPRPLLVRRVIARSWRRYRTKELLWGTNYEQFWPQLMVWRKESLVWWIVTQYRRRRQQLVHMMSDPRWAHIRFIRLTSQEEIDRWAELVEQHLSSRREVS